MKERVRMKIWQISHQSLARNYFCSRIGAKYDVVLNSFDSLSVFFHSACTKQVIHIVRREAAY